jgi:hypothetical protein
MSFGFAVGSTIPSFNIYLKKTFSGLDLARFNGFTNGIIIGSISLIIALIGLWFISSLWRGKKWALWLSLVLSIPSSMAPFGVVNYRSSDGSTIYIAGGVSVLITIYCVLRVAGSVGPKL